jgi:hypothetical protein
MKNYKNMTLIRYVGFEVLTAISKKMAAFRSVAPRRLVDTD